MENGDVLNQMAQYDFSTPINVTMIFEDSDEENSHQNIFKDKIINEECNITRLNDQDNIGTVNNEYNSTNKNISSKNDYEKESFVESHISINCEDVCSIIDENTKTIDSPSPTLEVEIINNHNSSFINNNIQALKEKTDSNISSIYQQINDKEELTVYVKDLLNTLSEHLILIMRPYYYYHFKNPNSAMPAELTTRLNKIKAHFFDLSYSTVVSLILPQEKNEYFITKFLNKTVTEANNMLNWNCKRHHVEPFYNEMIEWAKKKRAHIKMLSLPGANGKNMMNNNSLLREQLSNPTQPINVVQSTGTQLDAQNGYNRPSSDIENNTTCIFSSGSPGREVSINVTPITLMRQSQPKNSNQYVAPNKTKRPGKKLYPPTSQPAPRQTYNDNRVRQNHTIQYQPVLRPPPPYGSQTHNNIMTAPTPQNYHDSVNRIQNLQPMPNQHRNINSLSTLTHNNTNLGIMYNPQSEGQFTPVISNVTSLNPTASLMYGRCCICGKNTILRCSKCNNFSYCSYLCQELDSGVHNTMCGKSSY